MLNQFSRTQLVFGGEAMQVLARSRVAVFGIGGVGGYTVEALARSGVGALDLIDDDRVCLTNVNRQILCHARDRRQMQGRRSGSPYPRHQSQLSGDDIQDLFPARRRIAV